MAIDTIDPVGQVRMDYHMAYLESLITNLFIQTYGKKNAKLTNTDDFLIKWGESESEEKVQSVEEMKNILLNIASSQNRKVNSKK